MQGNVSQSPASSRAFNRRSFTPTQREKMANEQHSSSLRPWLLDAVPFVVVLLIAAHVLALVHSQKTTSFSYSFTFLSLSNSNQISDFLSLHALSGLLDLQISHRETASEEKGTLKTNFPKSNFIQQNGQRFWLNPNSSIVM